MAFAETLNGRVREIQKAGGTANYLNVVMLAAMELADDVLTMREEIEALRKEKEGMKETLDRRGRDLLATLEDALK
jgi:cell division protein ZapA (FtsZ GTPase activity inhibitor)